MENNNIISSDERIKQHIREIKKELSDAADSVGLVEFRYRDDAAHRKTYGVIAQDVERNGLHNLIHTDSEGMMKVDYTSFIILKLKALSDRIDAIEKKLDSK